MKLYLLFAIEYWKPYNTLCCILYVTVNIKRVKGSKYWPAIGQCHIYYFFVLKIIHAFIINSSFIFIWIMYDSNENLANEIQIIVSSKDLIHDLKSVLFKACIKLLALSMFIVKLSV